jgi:hypothetical protein
LLSGINKSVEITEYFVIFCESQINLAQRVL